MKKLIITVAVVYDYENETTTDELKHLAESAITREMGNGAFTGDTDAEIIEWELDIHEPRA